MPSITYWNRLEPRPFSEREEGLARNLAAEVRDPLWFLARQWQLGELDGEDAASPAYVSGSVRRTAFPDQRPFEPLHLGEGMPRNVSTSIEVGTWLEDALSAPPVLGAVALARANFPLVVDASRPETALERMARARAIDGWSLVARCRVDFDAVVSLIAPSAGDVAAVRAALQAVLEEVDAVFGSTAGAGGEPAAWSQSRLRYELSQEITTPDGRIATLTADPDDRGHVDWFTFDVASFQGRTAPPAPEPFAVIPSFVRFRGMPNHRFWDFEPGTTDFGDLTLGINDAARLVVVDFMLVHGNDWFVVPLEIPVASLAEVAELFVHDVFGGTARVSRIGADAAPSAERWSMFTLAQRADERLAPFLILPPSVAGARQSGPTLEDVRFIRDEMANMAWAIEAVTESALGEPQLADSAASTRGQAPAPPAAGIRYRIRTNVPQHWFPLIPVAVDPARGQIELERAAMLDDDGDVLSPRGVLLRPPVVPHRIREEELPRTGLRIERQVCRSRWIDGSTHVWVQRIRNPGRGEGRSGLAFDIGEGR